MRYFVAVAEELNFHRAAERLNLAQPALSSQIKDLEDELGARLLERTTRSVSLTPAGQVFLDGAREVLAKTGLAAQATRKAAHGQVGILRVGLVTTSATPDLAKVLRHFHQRYPAVQITVSDHTSAGQFLLLKRGELDVGLLRPPVASLDLEWREVEQINQVLAVPAGHRLARKKEIQWIDFDGEGLVMIQTSQQHGFYDGFLAACERAGAEVHPAQYVQDISSKMWLISAGFGIAPTTAGVSNIKRPGLVFRPLPPGLPPVQTVLVWRREPPNPIVRNFLECFNLLMPSYKEQAAAAKEDKDRKEN